MRMGGEALPLASSLSKGKIFPDTQLVFPLRATQSLLFNQRE